MFTLLPVQILLAVVNAVDNLISSYFASNFLGVNAMSAVGIYNPINMFINAIATILSGGSIIICGKYLGQNKRDELEEVFNLNLALSIFFSIILMLFFGFAYLFLRLLYLLFQRFHRCFSCHRLSLSLNTRFQSPADLIRPVFYLVLIDAKCLQDHLLSLCDSMIQPVYAIKLTRHLNLVQFPYRRRYCHVI